MELYSMIEDAHGLLLISLEDFNLMVNKSPDVCSETVAVDGSLEDLISQLSQRLTMINHSMNIVDVMLCLVCRKGYELTISDLCQINDSIKDVIAKVHSYRCGYAESNLFDVRKMEVMVIATD